MSDNKKNIIILFPDQLRADALSCNGNRAISTPNIDSISDNGVNYKNALSPTPLCVPARASFLTGEDSVVTGVVNNSGWLRPDRGKTGIKTWPEVLDSVGYETVAIGKMHFYPWDIDEGFKHRVIAEDKRHIHIHDDYQTALNKRGYKRVHGNESEGYFDNKGAIINSLPADLQIDKWVTDRSLEYLGNRNTKEPFALMIGFPGPHCPYDPPKEYIDKVDIDLIKEPDKNFDKWMIDECVLSNLRSWNGIDYSDMNIQHIKKIRHHYFAMVKQLDDCVGDILNYLDKEGLAENTTIIFSSDHGDYLGDRGLIGKMFYHNQSVNIPMLIKGEGFLPGEINTNLISLTDLYPTILNIANIKPYTQPENRYILGFLDSGYFVAYGSWRYSLYKNGESYLYNLESDPSESNNLASNSDNMDIISSLNKELMLWLNSSIVKSNCDKLLVPGVDDPSHSFYKTNWERPYPGSNKLI
ncbi:MAG: sulfatase-like hydrolase/transferase [Spirochaetaceae bacterium]